MTKCAECGQPCGEKPIVLGYGGDNIRFCSFECIIMYSVVRVRRRIARQNRSLRRLVQKEALCQSIPPHRATKIILN
jgi:hypothetical protein